MPAHDRRPYSFSQYAVKQRMTGDEVDASVPKNSPAAHFTPFSPITRVGEHGERDGAHLATGVRPVAGVASASGAAQEFEDHPSFEADHAGIRFDAAADLAFRYGEQYDSYQASEPDYEQFWSAERQGYVSYARAGRFVLVRGGLIAPPDHQEELLGQFLDHTVKRGLHVSFFNMSDPLIPLFRKYNFQVSKWGEEPIVDLSQCTFKGKPYEWVRRQTNYCIRNGLKAFEVRPDDLPPAVWHRMQIELNEVAADSISDKAQAGELRFFEGQLNAERLGHRRLFIAKSEWGQGRIEGFVVCNPITGGASWSTEIYRHRRDSVRGTIAFLFQHIIERLREEGLDRLHLCIVPGLRCQEVIPGDSRLARYSFRFAGPWMSCLFDMDGLSHFKSRFRPAYEKRYIFVHPKITIGSTMAFFKILGIFNISPVNFSRVLYQRWVKCSRRKTLAKLG